MHKMIEMWWPKVEYWQWHKLSISFELRRKQTLVPVRHQTINQVNSESQFSRIQIKIQ